MDITQCKKSRFTNSFMNGETVNYIISIILSFFVLIASKQVLKLFGMSAQIACWAAFAIGEIALFLLEKLFVYRDNALKANYIFCYKYRASPRHIRRSFFNRQNIGTRKFPCMVFHFYHRCRYKLSRFKNTCV